MNGDGTVLALGLAELAIAAKRQREKDILHQAAAVVMAARCPVCWAVPQIDDGRHTTTCTKGTPK